MDWLSLIKKRNSYKCELLEACIAGQRNGDMNNNFVSIFVKNKANTAMHPERIVNKRDDYCKGHSNLYSEFLRLEWETEAQRNLPHMRLKPSGENRKIAKKFWGWHRPMIEYPCLSIIGMSFYGSNVWDRRQYFFYDTYPKPAGFNQPPRRKG